jgi:hypothetical protein
METLTDITVWEVRFDKGSYNGSGSASWAGVNTSIYLKKGEGHMITLHIGAESYHMYRAVLPFSKVPVSTS